jgi:hypothetical protein
MTAFEASELKSHCEPLPPASATLVSTSGASKQGLVSKLVSQIDTREKNANTTSAADRKFKSPKATVKKEPEPEPTSPRKKSAGESSSAVRVGSAAPFSVFLYFHSKQPT